MPNGIDVLDLEQLMQQFRPRPYLHTNKIRMKIIHYLSILILMLLLSCKRSEGDSSKLGIARAYFSALNESDPSMVGSILGDSLTTIETEYDYQQTFTHEQYLEWVRWDSLFDPTYEVLYMEQVDDAVTARVSKLDRRIAFLHEGPIVTEQTIRFNGGQVTEVATTKYVNFNDSVFTANRQILLDWIDSHHPHLNGFIFGQTSAGGLRYLEALRLYEEARD